MLAKLTAKNQLTLSKSTTKYFEIPPEQDAVRAKLAALALSEQDIEDAVAWGRQSTNV
jgi:hypothetical protein